jgi:predicted AAA+ superfamily ATPase
MSWEESRQNSAKEHITPRELAEGLIRGGFPELVADPKIDSKLWYSSYLQTYLERDVRNIRQVGDLGEFQVFLQMIAARNGQILNMSEISKDIGVAVNTIKSWLSVLESSHQIVLVRPYFRNKGKRLIKSPKVYFVDTGLLCHLIGLGDPDHALKGPAAGSLFEAAVFGEMLRKFVNEGMPPRIYFWRTTSGDEIDFIVESPGALIPVEAKLTKTPTISLTRAIEDFSKLFPEARQGQIACLVDKRMTLSSHCSAIPLLQLTDILQEN